MTERLVTLLIGDIAAAVAIRKQLASPGAAFGDDHGLGPRLAAVGGSYPFHGDIRCAQFLDVPFLLVHDAERSIGKRGDHRPLRLLGKDDTLSGFELALPVRFGQSPGGRAGDRTQNT